MAGKLLPKSKDKCCTFELCFAYMLSLFPYNPKTGATMYSCSPSVNRRPGKEIAMRISTDRRRDARCVRVVALWLVLLSGLLAWLPPSAYASTVSLPHPIQHPPATFPHAPATQPVRRGEQSSPDTAGKLLWRYQTGNEVQGQATVKKGVVYMGSDDLYMYALKASDGTLLWRYHTGYMGANITHPAVVNGIVYFGSGDDNVYALKASTGTLIWLHQTGGYVSSAPAVVNGVVYVGSDDDYVYALKASTGALIWRYKTGNSVEYDPAVVNGVVYIGSWDRYIYALNARTAP